MPSFRLFFLVLAVITAFGSARGTTGPQEGNSPTQDLSDAQRETASSYLTDLALMGLGLADIYDQRTVFTDFSDLYSALSSLPSSQLVSLPPPEQVFTELELLHLKIRRYIERGYVLSLEHLAPYLIHNPTTLKSTVPTYNFSEALPLIHSQWLRERRREKDQRSLFSKLVDKVSKRIWGSSAWASAWNDFYTQLYLQLSDKALLSKLPPLLKNQPAGSALDVEVKRNFLIYFLAGLKDPSSQQKLSDGIVATRQPIYLLAGLAPDYVDELRLKLLVLSTKVGKLDEGDQLLLASRFIHAGRHCNDAKISVIREMFGRFCHLDQQYLDRYHGSDGSLSLWRRAELIAAREKSVKLQRLVTSTIDRAIAAKQTRLPNSPIGLSSPSIERERTTVEMATWDRYAPYLGLPRRGGSFPCFALEMQEYFFAAGNYSPRHLYNVIAAELGGEILAEAAGSLGIFVPYPEVLVLGALQDWEFLTPNEAWRLYASL